MFNQCQNNAPLTYLTIYCQTKCINGWTFICFSFSSVCQTQINLSKVHLLFVQDERKAIKLSEGL